MICGRLLQLPCHWALERGERPTVERVRVELGRGSPARVGQLLEAWWDALAKRLAGENRLPDMPKAASAAFTDLWRVATDEARAQLEAALAQRRAALDAEAAQWASEKAELTAQLERADSDRIAAIESRARSDVRLEDLQRLLVQQETQHAGDVRRLEELRARVEALEQERRELAERLAAREAAAAQERDAGASHLRAVEDRANVEIDRARQEAKGLRARVDHLEHQGAQAAEASRHRESEARQALARSEQAVAEQRARVQALEEQLARLDGLGEALRSAQDAVRAGLEREAQLRNALEQKTRGKMGPTRVDCQKTPRKKALPRTQRP